MPTPSIVSINPFRCQMWSFHDRIFDGVTEENCRAEIDSFLRHGQLVPALGRALRNNPDFDIELVCGARRLFVARYLNKPLMVEVRDLTDRDAVVAMDIENRHRTDVSAYERGASYARLLRAGHFKTQDDLARALKVSAAQVSRLLKLARLPSIIMEAFGGPVNIREGWGLDILDALDDPLRRSATLKVARSICAEAARASPPTVYRLLLSATARGRKIKPRERDEVIKGNSGQSLFRIRHQSQAIALLLPRDRVCTAMLDRIRGHVTEVLQEEL